MLPGGIEQYLADRAALSEVVARPEPSRGVGVGVGARAARRQGDGTHRGSAVQARRPDRRLHESMAEAASDHVRLGGSTPTSTSCSSAKSLSRRPGWQRRRISQPVGYPHPTAPGDRSVSDGARKLRVVALILGRRHANANAMNAFSDAGARTQIVGDRGGVAAAGVRRASTRPHAPANLANRLAIVSPFGMTLPSRN